MTLDDRLRRTGDAIHEMASQITPRPVPAPPSRRRFLASSSTVLAPIAVGLAVLAMIVLLGDRNDNQVVQAGRPASTATVPPPTTVAMRPPPRYQDTYSDRLSGWEEAIDAKGSIGYSEGNYRVSIDQPNRGTFVPAPWSDIPTDVTVQADAVKHSDGPGSFGLACRDAGGQRYSGLVDIDMTWRITRIDSRGEQPRPLKTGTAAAVRAGEPNVVTFQCAGETAAAHGAVTLTLWVNGQQVGQVIDQDGLPTGRVGVEVASGASPVSVTFDNFTGRDN